MIKLIAIGIITVAVCTLGAILGYYGLDAFKKKH